ncbi:UNVERIFIED_CONTAM: hypothetical protein K2H54_032812 [Gekko kuhli]
MTKNCSQPSLGFTFPQDEGLSPEAAFLLSSGKKNHECLFDGGKLGGHKANIEIYLLPKPPKALTMSIKAKYHNIISVPCLQRATSYSTYPEVTS